MFGSRLHRGLWESPESPTALAAPVGPLLPGRPSRGHKESYAPRKPERPCSRGMPEICLMVLGPLVERKRGRTLGSSGQLHRAVTQLRDTTGLATILKGQKVSLNPPDSLVAVFGEVVAARPGALAVTVEPQGSGGPPFAPGMRLSGVVVLPDSRGSFYATVAKVEGNTILLHELSDIRIESGCRMFRRRCDLPGSYSLVWPSPQREPADGQSIGQELAKPARCRDLSIGGIALEVMEPVWAGDRLRVEIALPDSDAPVAVVCEVMWTEDRAADCGTVRRVGLQFVEVSRADAARIKAFVSAGTQRSGNVTAYPSPNDEDQDTEPRDAFERRAPERLNPDLLIH